MDVKILSGDFKLRCVLDSFNALTFSESFNEAGQLFLSVPFERKIYDSLDTPCRILIDSRLFGVDKVSATESEIRVWGSGILKELSEFYISLPETNTASPCDLLCSFASRASFDGVSYRVNYVTESDQRVVESYDWCSDLYTVMTQICFDHSIGMKMTFDFSSLELVFTPLTMRDRASNDATLFTTISDDHGSYIKIESVCDSSEYKNQVELIYRMEGDGELESYLFSRRQINESVRGYIEHPGIIARTPTAKAMALDARARQVFKEHRKKRYFKITSAHPLHCQLGDYCIIKSNILGESEYALLTQFKSTLVDGVTSESLLFEVI